MEVLLAMMLEFVHALIMSLAINVMLVHLGGMVFQAVKVRYILSSIVSWELFFIIFEIIFRMSL